VDEREPALIAVSGVALDEIRRLTADGRQRSGTARLQGRSVVFLRDQDDDAGVLAREIDQAVDRGGRPLGVRQIGVIGLQEQLRCEDAAVVLVDEDRRYGCRIDFGHGEGQQPHLLLHLPDLDPRLALGVGPERQEAREQRHVVVGRLDVERFRAARVAGRQRVPVVVQGVVEADAGHRVAGVPVSSAVENDTDVVRLLNLLVVRAGTAVRVAGILERRRLDSGIGCDRIAELEGAADELRRPGKRRRVDERLVVLLVDVHVSDVEHDRREPEKRRNEQRKEHDDLAPLVGHALAARGRADSPVHDPPQDVFLAFWTHSTQM
jgi:hypothetical protein